MGVQETPGASVGTTNSDNGCLPDGPGSGWRATTRTACTLSIPDVQYFVPLMRHPSPDGCAVVVTMWLFEPASGSVIAKAIFSEPSAIPGSHCDFISWLPCLSRIEPQIAGEMTLISSGQPWVAVSSMMTARSVMVPPPPPYSTERCTPRNPA